MAELAGYAPKLTDLFELIINRKLSDTNVMKPGKIVAVKDTGLVDVLPLFKIKNQDGTFESASIIPDCMVASHSGSNTKYISIPPVVGALGVIGYCDESLEDYNISNGQEIENTEVRIHDDSDAIFFPMFQPEAAQLSGVDTDNVTMRNNDMSVILHPGGQIEISGAAEELITVLSDFLGELQTYTIATSLGPQPFIPTDVAKIAALKTRLDTMKV